MVVFMTMFLEFHSHRYFQFCFSIMDYDNHCNEVVYYIIDVRSDSKVYCVNGEHEQR